MSDPTAGPDPAHLGDTLRTLSLAFVANAATPEHEARAVETARERGCSEFEIRQARDEARRNQAALVHTFRSTHR